MFECCEGEQQDVQAGVAAHEEQLAAVVVPVRPGQVSGRVSSLLLAVRGLQPVSSTVERTIQTIKGKGNNTS